MAPLAEIADLVELRQSATSAPLLRLVDGWLRRDARAG